MAKDNGGNPVRPNLANPQQPTEQQPVASQPTSAAINSLTTQDLLALLEKQGQQIAQLQAQQAGTVTQTAAPAHSMDILAREAMALRKRKDQKDRLDQWHSLTLQERSQQECDRQYPDGPKRFRVELLGKPSKMNDLEQPDPNAPRLPHGFPILDINANSALEAQGRYQVLCGIRWLQGPDWRITEIARPAFVAPAGPAPNDMTPPEELLQLSLLQAS